MIHNLILFVYLVWGGPARATQPPETDVLVLPAFEARADCEVRLLTTSDAVRLSLKRKRARWGRAYLGSVDDLAQLLLEAGVHSGRIIDYLTQLDRLRGDHFLDASLKDLSVLYERLCLRGQLNVAVLSADCSLSTTARPFAVTSLDRKHAVVVLPHPTQYADEFAVDVLTALSALAAKNLYRAWTEALITVTEPGQYDRFAAAEDFGLLFRTLYKLHQRHLLESDFAPSSRSADRRAMIRAAYRELATETARGGIRDLVIRLDLTEVNLLATARRIVEDVRATVIRAPR